MSPVVVLVAVVALPGCSPDDGPGLATAVPSQSPAVSSGSAEPSASEDPLVAEARDLHQRYLDTTAAILQSGTIPTDAFRDTSTPEHALTAIADAQATLDQGIRTEGVPTNASFEFVEQSRDRAVAAVCVDNSEVVVKINGEVQKRTQPLPRLVVYDLSDGARIDDLGTAPENMGLQC